MGQAVKEFNKAKEEIERELTKAGDVTPQPAQGQQPRQPAELPAAPVAQVQATPPAEPAAPAPQPAHEGERA
jgi:hypothetical protein